MIPANSILHNEPFLVVPGLIVVFAFLTLWVGDRSRRYFLLWGLGSGLLALSVLWIPVDYIRVRESPVAVLLTVLLAYGGVLAMFWGAVVYTGRVIPASRVMLPVVAVICVVLLSGLIDARLAARVFDAALGATLVGAGYFLYRRGGPGERIAAVLFAFRALNGNYLTELIDGYRQLDRVTINQLLGFGAGVALLCAGFLRSISNLDASQRLLGMMHSVAACFAGGSDCLASLRQAVELLRKETSSDVAVLLALGPGAVAGSLLVQSGGSHSLGSRLDGLPVPGTALDRALRTGRAISLNVRGDSARWGADEAAVFAQEQLGSAVIVPIFQGESSSGLLILASRNEREFASEELSALGSIGRSFGLAQSLAEHMEQVRYEATHDRLTGLLNRNSLAGLIAKREAADGDWFGAALLLIDLDAFREVNDTLGHDKGDELLVAVARRLEEQLPERDRFVARLGGDDFAVLVFGRNAGDTAVADAGALLESLRLPVEIGGISLAVDASIGIAIAPGHARDSDALLRCAEVAMYRAKGAGSMIVVYGPELDPHTRERLSLMSSLKQALPQRELRLHYQPKINLRSGEVMGAEALIRWQHPRLGLVPPGRFMPMAEVSPIINEITTWVAGQALEQISAWMSRGRPLAIAVNMSARNLVHSRLILDLLAMVREAGVPPGLLEFEITEGALMHDPGDAQRKLRMLAEAGVRLSIDDFGTGYSSLAYLQKLPIHTLKIDRSFVDGACADGQKLRIAEAVTNLAKGLDLAVVAEGVETVADHAHMRALGCDYGQGFLYSKALTASEFDIWLAGWRHLRRSLGLETGPDAPSGPAAR